MSFARRDGSTGDLITVGDTDRANTEIDLTDYDAPDKFGELDLQPARHSEIPFVQQAEDATLLPTDS